MSSDSSEWRTADTLCLAWGLHYSRALFRVPVLLSAFIRSYIPELQMSISPCSCSSQATDCYFWISGKGSRWGLVGFLGSPHLASVLVRPCSPICWGWSFLSISDLCPYYSSCSPSSIPTLPHSYSFPYICEGFLKVSGGMYPVFSQCW